MNRSCKGIISAISTLLILFNITYNSNAQVVPSKNSTSEKNPQSEEKQNKDNKNEKSQGIDKEPKGEIKEGVKEETPQEALYKIYTERNKALVTGDMSKLKTFFDTRQNLGTWALEHEVRRVKYLRHWSQERGIEFTNIDSQIRVKRTSNRGAKVVMALEESYKFDYIYSSDDPAVLNSFGVGIRHGVSMIKRDNKWIIYNDWYTDCFEDAIAGFTGDIPTYNTRTNEYTNGRKTIKKIVTNAVVQGAMKGYVGYNREKAVNYADKYCGSAWGSGNNYKYNTVYKDFTGIGGDCTNFVSQVLGDKKEGGGLRHGGGWHCEYEKYGSQGSRSWVNADGLRDYLIYSGRGSLIKRGTYKELSSGNESNPTPAVDRLLLGDVIAYQKKSDIDHFAVVTGRDSRGYPLVNSHTTDRYHVPWDLGWGDKWIKFHLIRIN